MEAVSEERVAYLLRRKQSYQRNKDKIAARTKVFYQGNKELMAQRKGAYLANNKDKVDVANKAYNVRTKAVRAEKSRAKRNENIELYNQKQREYKAAKPKEQKDREAKWRKEYRERNREKEREYQKSRMEINRENKKLNHAKRYAEDMNYKILHNLRSRIKGVLRHTKKSDRSVVLLGCTVAELRDHLLSLFTEGMTWELFMSGEIHVDHIRPCASFDLTIESEQFTCFNYKNLQPLWGIDNLKKSSKWAGQ